MKLNKKNKLLVFSFFLLSYASYKFAIANTIQVYNSYNSKQETLATSSMNSNAAAALLRRENELDTLLSHYSIKTSVSFQNELLQKLNSFCAPYNLKIISFEEPHIIKSNLSTTTNYFFSVRGSFNGCIDLINKVENNPVLGAVEHIEFIKKKNFKTNINELTAEIYLQHVKSN